MRKYSMNSLKRRNHQRWFNQYCRYVNKQIENDDLWLGRFYVKQIKTEMDWFDDKSGGLMYAQLIMCDRKTNITRIGWYSGLEMNWKFWYDFNNFIIQDCKVWEEEPSPYDNRIDYRKKGTKTAMR